MKKIPIIGITKKFHPNRSLSFDFIAKNIDNANFLDKIFPTDQIILQIFQNLTKLE